MGSKYWTEREKEALKHYIKQEDEYLKVLNGIYEDMLQEIAKEIESFYSRYATKEGISVSEAKKRVSKLDIESYERKAKKYVKEKDFSDKANEEMRLYNATMRINRLEMLKAKIGLELVAGHNGVDKNLQEWLGNRAEEEATRMAGILGKSVAREANVLGSIVNASFKNATFSERIWGNQELLRDELSKKIQTGLIRGKSSLKLASDIRNIFNVSKSNAERLMRTEMARVQTDVQMKSFEANGFDMYEYIALSDRRTCGACAALDGKKFKVKDMEVGENAPPMHPNCRCSTAAYMDDKVYTEWLDTGAAKHGVKYELFNELYGDYSSKHKDLTQEERVVHDDDYDLNKNRNEVAVAKWLTQVFGGKIKLITEKNNFNEGSPDYCWNGKLWDLKTPKKTNGTDKLVHKGIHQIEKEPGGVVVNCPSKETDIGKAIKIAKRRFERSEKEKGTWLIIVRDNEIYAIDKKE